MSGFVMALILVMVFGPYDSIPPWVRDVATLVTVVIAAAAIWLQNFFSIKRAEDREAFEKSLLDEEEANLKQALRMIFEGVQRDLEQAFTLLKEGRTFQDCRIRPHELEKMLRQAETEINEITPFFHAPRLALKVWGARRSLKEACRIRYELSCHQTGSPRSTRELLIHDIGAFLRLLYSVID